jgi:hypothetical protein
MAKYSGIPAEDERPTHEIYASRRLPSDMTEEKTVLLGRRQPDTPDIEIEEGALVEAPGKLAPARLLTVKEIRAIGNAMKTYSEAHKSNTCIASTGLVH